jgi:ABC-type Zn uptake system ZnuABC Zn-binding protein ZnuA
MTITALILAAAAAIAGCQGFREAEKSGLEPLTVVTTIFPLADMVKNIGGETVEVYFLLPPGASPHTYDPTVDQVLRVAGARLFVCIGGGLDDWAVTLADAAAKDLVLLKLTEEETLPVIEDHAADNDHPPGEHDHGPVDPHIWLDPIIVRDVIGPAITEALAALNPAGAPSYRANLAAYQAELSALDGEIRAALAGLNNRKFISFHSAWRYFARRYGLEEAAVIAAFPGQEPSAAWIARLVDLSRAHGVKVIFAEPQFSAVMVKMLAAETGAKTAVLDPLGGPDLPRANTYINLMRDNLAVLKEALAD